ncbi:unnamed protein product [Bursaphelenchus xylophilus]|uniref:Cytochrome b-c1 complex subunit 8 n=1 Tax=Bursaphelenchus xylophilus TaxID=6326 RepID=A0A1I7SDX4_BURXY|nr:unnamed protein product [Bursaphelenchus xylophilus]CAG9100348.1 unnamed protein product [Bursaphelenchus xylophilus]
MRITSIVKSHKHFGNLGKIYGQYKWSIAPNEQDAWKGFFKAAVVNVFDEYVVRSWYYIVPPAVGTYLLYDWAKKENARVNKKNPADYANDV